MNRLKLISVLFLLSLNGHSKELKKTSECDWCVYKSDTLASDIKALANKPPEEQLKDIRSQGICVLVMESGRKTPKDFFTWGKIEAPKESLQKITKQKNVMGKTLCKSEHELSAKCLTIALASDAPKSTLIHEFLHAKQIQKDSKWCGISKKLWQRAPTEEEAKMIRDKEWDVHRFLWENRQSLNFNIEDDLAVVSETLEGAMQRRKFDSTATDYTKEQKMEESLTQLIQKYKSSLLSK